jgi:aminocarboxymuconate-semialdehyde decarboxylase
MKDGYKVVDIHNHHYTRAWVDYLASRTEDPVLKWIEPNKKGVFWGDGIIFGHLEKPGHWDIDARVTEIDELGIDIQLLTLTAPSIEIAGSEAVEWAKRVNDELADACHKYPDRFFFSASVPAEDIDATLKEMERAKGIGARGIQMFSNIRGESAASEKFYPIFELCADLGLVVQIHPAARPLTADAMKHSGLPYQMLGFTMDTTMAVISMIFRGVFDKYPTLKVHHCHLGGMAPYMMGRIDTAYKRYNKEWNMVGAKLPSATYKERVYVDALGQFVPAIKCALEYMGADRLMWGSDHPHIASGTVPDNLEILNKVGLTEEQKEMVYSKNATKLFNME